MAAAPMKYNQDGSVDWGNMWDTFCELAQAGGPPHRSTILEPDEQADPNDPAYQHVVDELIRGIDQVSGLPAHAAAPGWVAINCIDSAMAAWLAEAILAENVRARSNEALLLVPAGAHYTLKGEIKNVITAVAKTTHYWGEHLPNEVKATLAMQERLSRFGRSLARIFRRS
jgi:sirohydrochlorin cobaltochelatase